jgi:hypothetical protein
MVHKTSYPMGSISHGTMREEDLIPDFCANLYHCAKVSKSNGHYHTIGDVTAKTRKAHVKLVKDIEERMEEPKYFEDGDSTDDLESLFDALNEYAAPYFYFGAHPGDGSDYGFWLYDSFEYDFDGLKVSDSSELPKGYKGEYLVVNDHGNMTLMVKSARKAREVWAVV